jgi:3-oxoacyl-[acyl-carrier-protein] synthase II
LIVNQSHYSIHFYPLIFSSLKIQGFFVYIRTNKSLQMELKRVVVTGLGALTPIGNNIQEYWDGLINGRSGAAPITYYDTEKHKTKFACEIKNFNVEDFIDRKEVRRLDKFAQYAIVASDEAIKDAGITLDNVDKYRVGVIWGAGIGGLETFQDEVLNYAAKETEHPRFNPFFIPKMIADIAPGHISMKNGLWDLIILPFLHVLHLQMPW